MNRPENAICVDCPERQPRWASLIKIPGAPSGTPPVGAFMCLECSGSHRRLGVHIAFVRSINLDSWKEHEVLAMERGGNKRINQIFEAHLQGQSKLTNIADGPQRERYIRDKYERRKFFDPRALDAFLSGKGQESSEEDDDEAVVATVVRKTPSSVLNKPAAPPSEAAQRRVAARDARNNGGPLISAPPRLSAVATAPAPVAPPPPVPAPVVAPPAAYAQDLLSFSIPPSTPTGTTTDLFATMTTAPTPAASVPKPQQQSNADIMSLFSTTNSTPMMTNNGFVSHQQQQPMMMTPQQMAMMQQQQQQILAMQQQFQAMNANSTHPTTMGLGTTTMLPQGMMMMTMPQQQTSMGATTTNNNNMMMMGVHSLTSNHATMGGQPMGGSGMMGGSVATNNSHMMGGQPMGGMPMGGGGMMGGSVPTNNSHMMGGMMPMPSSNPQPQPKEDPFAQFGGINHFH